MKIKLLMISAILALLSAGCSTVGKLVDSIPEGKADRIRYTRTGKFSSTTVTVTGWSKTDAIVKAESLQIQSSNAWMPNLQIELNKYERNR